MMRKRVSQHCSLCFEHVPHILRQAVLTQPQVKRLLLRDLTGLMARFGYNSTQKKLRFGWPRAQLHGFKG
jgi:hypothetical protein